MNITIQRVEFCKFYDIPVFCPFCGAMVFANSMEDPAANVNPCRHTLFVAHDEGFEYVSDKPDLDLSNLNLDVISELQIGVDQATDSVVAVDAVKFAFYVPAPSGFGSYSDLHRHTINRNQPPCPSSRPG